MSSGAATGAAVTAASGPVGWIALLVGGVAVGLGAGAAAGAGVGAARAPEKEAEYVKRKAPLKAYAAHVAGLFESFATKARSEIESALEAELKRVRERADGKLASLDDMLSEARVSADDPVRHETIAGYERELRDLEADVAQLRGLARRLGLLPAAS